MIKTLTFAVMHFCVAFAVTFLITGDVLIGGAVALIEPAINTVGYYFHEKVWQRIKLQDRNAWRDSLMNIAASQALR